MTQRVFRFVALSTEGMLLLWVNERHDLESGTDVGGVPSQPFQRIIDVAGRWSGLLGDRLGVLLATRAKTVVGKLRPRNQSQTDDLG